jgi:hypothetical protein
MATSFVTLRALAEGSPEEILRLLTQPQNDKKEVQNDRIRKLRITPMANSPKHNFLSAISGLSFTLTIGL